MNSRITITVKPQVTTVQAPYVEFDQWGNSRVTYRPLELTSFQVTFPTGPIQYVTTGSKHEVSK